jgi:phosphoglycolate phosphatase
LRVAVLDVDGTLIDSNYHHAIAWYRALRRFGCTQPLFELHRYMGMGGDQLVGEIAGEEFEREHGEDVRAAEKELYGELIAEVQPLEGARALIDALLERDFEVVLASSAKEEEVEHYIELLGSPDLPYTSSADVERTKPAPDLVHSALQKLGGDAEAAVMIGDSTWDCIAAGKAGVPTLGVLTGGFSREDLLDAGAREVFTRLPDLIEALGESQIIDALA